MSTELDTKPSKPMTSLKQWKVIVHNDDINTFDHVIGVFIQVVNLESKIAVEKTNEVHKNGLTIVTVTHKEKAELIQGQLQSKSLTVSIEPD